MVFFRSENGEPFSYLCSKWFLCWGNVIAVFSMNWNNNLQVLLIFQFQLLILVPFPLLDISAFSHFLPHAAIAISFSFPFFIPQFFCITFFFFTSWVFYGISHSYFTSYCLAIPFWGLFFPFASSCSSLSFSSLSLPLIQPSSSHQPHSLKQLPQPTTDPKKQCLLLCPSFRNWAPYPPLRWACTLFLFLLLPHHSLHLTSSVYRFLSTQDCSYSTQTSPLAMPRPSGLTRNPPEHFPALFRVSIHFPWKSPWSLKVCQTPTAVGLLMSLRVTESQPHWYHAAGQATSGTDR